jgi:hypothetical protein
VFRFPTEENQKWEPDQAGALRTFLNSPHGQACLRQLYLLRPTLAMPSAYVQFDPAKRAAEAEHVAGFENCIQTLLNLTIPVPENQHVQRPPI